ncbi:redoxin domain-containing protein [bacterium]|nr:redoxin domain-containing protein [bacterium]
MVAKGLFFLLFWTSIYTAPLQIGADAPSFVLKDQEGFVHNLSAHRGSYVLLYFYSRDYTFSAQRSIEKIERLLKNSLGDKLVVFGISKYCVEEQRKFYDKLHISFDLLCDNKQEIISAYGAKGFLGVKQKIVLIGPDGRLFRVYDDVQKFLDAKDLIKSIINGGI